MSNPIITEYSGSSFDSGLESIIRADSSVHGSNGSALYSLIVALRAAMRNDSTSHRIKQVRDECTTVAHYLAEADDCTVSLKITSCTHGATISNPVKHADTANDIIRLSDSIRGLGLCAYSAIPSIAFNHCSASSIFQTDMDDGEWTIYFNDRRNRTIAVLTIMANAAVDN